MRYISKADENGCRNESRYEPREVFAAMSLEAMIISRAKRPKG
jgi:hypothetical protein